MAARRLCTLLLAASLVLYAGPMRAQEAERAAVPAPLELVPGKRLRVLAPVAGIDERRGAMLLAAGQDSLFLQVGDSQLQVAMRDIAALDVHAGRKSRTHGGTVGVAGGAALGLVAALLMRKLSPEQIWVVKCSEQDPSQCSRVSEDRSVQFPSRRDASIMGAVTVTGATLGAFLPGDRWRRFPLPVRPAGGGTVGIASPR